MQYLHSKVFIVMESSFMYKIMLRYTHLTGKKVKL